jgi:hypothetical protein
MGLNTANVSDRHEDSQGDCPVAFSPEKGEAESLLKFHIYWYLIDFNGPFVVGM